MPCKTYKIGVFFDGTGNDAAFDSSNGRDQQSNVAKLHKLYKTGEFESKESCKVTAILLHYSIDCGKVIKKSIALKDEKGA